MDYQVIWSPEALDDVDTGYIMTNLNKGRSVWPSKLAHALKESKSFEVIIVGEAAPIYRTKSILQIMKNEKKVAFLSKKDSNLNEKDNKENGNAKNDSTVTKGYPSKT